MSQKYKIIQRI